MLSLKKKTEFSAWESKIKNEAKKYGHIDKIIRGKAAPTFEDELAPRDKTSEAYWRWQEVAKENLKDAKKFADHSQSFAAILKENIEGEVAEALSVNSDYNKAYEDNDVAGMWKVIKNYCEKSDVPDFKQLVLAEFWMCAQDKISLDQYIEEIEKKLKKLRELNVAPGGER